MLVWTTLIIYGLDGKQIIRKLISSTSKDNGYECLEEYELGGQLAHPKDHEWITEKFVTSKHDGEPDPGFRPVGLEFVLDSSQALCLGSGMTFTN